MSVIANTTVISNFASIHQLDLLRRLYGVLYISTEVYEEIQIGLEEGYRFYEGIDALVYPLVEEGWIRLTSMTDERELRLFGELPSRLHRGEASCLAIARHRGWMLLTDDRDVRNEASQLGIRVSGSVGSLVLAVESGLCTLQPARERASMAREIFRKSWPIFFIVPPRNGITHHARGGQDMARMMLLIPLMGLVALLQACATGHQPQRLGYEMRPAVSPIRGEVVEKITGGDEMLGHIDWDNWVLYAVGSGIPPAYAQSAAQARELAKRAAIDEAYAACWRRRQVRGYTSQRPSTIWVWLMPLPTCRPKLSSPSSGCSSCNRSMPGHYGSWRDCVRGMERCAA